MCSERTEDSCEYSSAELEAISSLYTSSEYIFVAELESKSGLRTTRTIPPVRIRLLKFGRIVQQRAAQNGFDSNTKFTYYYKHSDENLNAKDVYLVGGKYSSEIHTITVIKEFNSVKRFAENLHLVPGGWVFSPGGWLSPFPVINPVPEWYEQIVKMDAGIRCLATNRPGLLCPDGIEMHVKQVITDEAYNPIAPYGNGQFYIILANANSKPTSIPALLFDRKTNRICWSASLVVVDQETQRRYCLPGAASESAGQLEPCQLDPDQVVGTIVDLLTLSGDDYWKRGTRVYFSFCLGDLVQESFFYYHPPVHDAMHHEKIGKTPILPAPQTTLRNYSKA